MRYAETAVRLCHALPAAAASGHGEKTVKAWVCLGANGTFLGVRQDGEDEYFCPDIGSLANGKDKCNVLVEKTRLSSGKIRRKAKLSKERKAKAERQHAQASILSCFSSAGSAEST